MHFELSFTIAECIQGFKLMRNNNDFLTLKTLTGIHIWFLFLALHYIRKLLLRQDLPITTVDQQRSWGYKIVNNKSYYVYIKFDAFKMPYPALSLSSQPSYPFRGTASNLKLVTFYRRPMLSRRKPFTRSSSNRRKICSRPWATLMNIMDRAFNAFSASLIRFQISKSPNPCGLWARETITMAAEMFSESESVGWVLLLIRTRIRIRGNGNGARSGSGTPAPDRNGGESL